jgi:hypothetical protein
MVVFAADRPVAASLAAVDRPAVDRPVVDFLAAPSAIRAK